MSATLEVKGLKELEDQLLELGAVGAERVARSAARKSVEDVLAEAKRLVPKRTGDLYDALAITTKGPNKGISGAIATAGLTIRKVSKKLGRATGTRSVKGAAPEPRRYWHLVEFGTSRTAAHPFIRPAFDGRLDQMLERLREQLARKIDSALRRQLRSGG